MSLSSVRRLAAVAAPAVALSAASSFSPPWISIETPPNPYDPASRGAFLVVHTFHHGELAASRPDTVQVLESGRIEHCVVPTALPT